MAGLQDQLIRSTTPSPPKIILYGQAKVGKTTFAADAKAALIDCENGAGNVANLVRTPYLPTWKEQRQWLFEFTSNPPEGTQAVAIDTIDWMIRRIEEHVTLDLDPKREAGDITGTIGTAHDGFYKARDIVKNIVHRDLFPALNAIVTSGRPVILLAHAANVKLKTPEGSDVRTAAPSLPPYILETFIEWADAVFYATELNDQRTVRTRGTGVVRAGNRYDLDPVEPFDWNHIATKIKQHQPRGSATTMQKGNDNG